MVATPLPKWTTVWRQGSRPYRSGPQSLVDQEATAVAAGVEGGTFWRVTGEPLVVKPAVRPRFV